LLGQFPDEIFNNLKLKDIFVFVTLLFFTPSCYMHGCF